MPNHLHLIWQIQPGHEREQVQRDFLKYTAQKIRFDLVENNPELLKEFEVAASDRKYQFWERNTLSIDLFLLHECWNSKSPTLFETMKIIRRSYASHSECIPLE